MEQQRRRLEVWVTSVVATVVIAIGAVAPHATAQTLAWDPSPDASVAGYRVRYGASAAALDAAVDVGGRFELPLRWWPRDRPWFFCVEAYNASFTRSRCSDVVVLTPNADDPGGGAIETYAQWVARLAPGAESADPDDDGVTNANEFLARTDPFVPNRWLFAEGATGAFREEIALANPTSDSALVRLRFLREGADAVETVAALGPASRATVVVNDVPGLGATSAGVELIGTYGAVVAERTMTWTAPGGSRPSHTAKAVAAPSTEWYFAEGEARLTDTWFLVANAGTSATSVTFEFMTDLGARVVRTYTVGPQARFTVWANAIAELAGNSFATTVRATQPVIAERAVYFWSGTSGWRGGHVSAGATAPAQRWFVAEGRTGPFFDTYVLIGNPGASAVTATLRYLTQAGLTRTDVVTIGARSRLTIPVDHLKGLEDTDVSVDVSTSGPVIVERSMYWPGDASSWREGHNSVALAELGTRWVLADGRWRDSAAAESYLLLANPGNLTAVARVRVLREYGRPPLSVDVYLPPSSRQTIRIDDTVGLQAGERFSLDVTSTQPIAVERSMYTSVGGTWTSGSNETGTRIK